MQKIHRNQAFSGIKVVWILSCSYFTLSCFKGLCVFPKSFNAIRKSWEESLDWRTPMLFDNIAVTTSNFEKQHQQENQIQESRKLAKCVRNSALSLFLSTESSFEFVSSFLNQGSFHPRRFPVDNRELGEEEEWKTLLMSTLIVKEWARLLGTKQLPTTSQQRLMCDEEPKKRTCCVMALPL